MARKILEPIDDLLDGEITELSEVFLFEVVQLHEGALEGDTPENVAKFWREIEDMQRVTSASSLALTNALKRVDAMRIALERTQTNPQELEKSLFDIKQELLILDERLNGNRSKQEIGERSPPSIRQRLNVASYGTTNSTYGPTPTHKRSMEIAKEEYKEVKSLLENIRQEQIPALEKQLTYAGAPWIEGQPLPEGE